MPHPSQCRRHDSTSSITLPYAYIGLPLWLINSAAKLRKNKQTAKNNCELCIVYYTFYKKKCYLCRRKQIKSHHEEESSGLCHRLSHTTSRRVRTALSLSETGAPSAAELMAHPHSGHLLQVLHHDCRRAHLRACAAPPAVETDPPHPVHGTLRVNGRCCITVAETHLVPGASDMRLRAPL